jgi:hypothetical protein
MSTIKQLFLTSRPPAIPWFVIAVIVDAFKRQLGWWVTHVSVKVRKIVKPAFADCDAASSVVFIGRKILEETPILHPSPAGVGACALASTVLSMSDAPVTSARIVFHERIIAGI